MAEALGLLEALFLGVLQGLTEWLPVSSSGHLVLAQAFLGVEVPLFFDLVLHLGTLLVVVFFFRATVLEILRAFVALPRDARAGDGWARALWADPERRLGLLVVVATIPTAIVGIALNEVFEMKSALAVGFALLFTGTYLWFTKYAKGTRSLREMSWRDAVIIGTAQSAAIFHGVSRSGSTISAAKFLGLDREVAVRFSFLLSIPTILGAAIVEADPAALADAGGNPLAYAVGFLAAIVVGYLTIAALVAIVRRRGFHYFSFYCWAVGAGVVLWGLTVAP